MNDRQQARLIISLFIKLLCFIQYLCQKEYEKSGKIIYEIGQEVEKLVPEKE